MSSRICVLALHCWLLLNLVSNLEASGLKLCKDSPEGSIDESFYTIFGWKTVKENMERPFHRSRTEQLVSLHAHREPHTKTQSCPTRGVINYDPKRIPNILFEGRCDSTSCRPLYYFRRVLVKNGPCYRRRLKALVSYCELSAKLTFNDHVQPY